MGSPRIIFGAATIGMSFTTVRDVQEVLDLLKKNNITHIDTAGRYPPTSTGRSEELLGEVQAASQGFTIDTKILARTETNGAGELERSAIEESIATSLQRLGVEQVNTLYIHRPDPETPLKEQAKALDNFHKAGKFKQLGVSNFKPELLEEFLEICDTEGYIKPSVYQGDYSAVTRGMEKHLLPLLRRHGIAFNAFRTLAAGFLSGNFTHGTTKGTRFDGEFPLSKLMKNLYDQESLHEALRKLESKTQTLGITTIDAALRWAFYHSALAENDGVILGASKLSQLESNIRSINSGPLPKDCVLIFEEIWEELEPVRRDIL